MGAQGRACETATGAARHACAGSAGAMEIAVSDRRVEQLYKFIADHPQGVVKEELEAAGWTDQALVVNTANPLLAQGRVEIVNLGNQRFLYRATDTQTVLKFRGLDVQHRAVYQIISDAGNKGCWNRTLKDKSNLQQHTITKVTKELLRRSLIKEVKSVQQRGRKVFMVWEVEPAPEVSGGTWYHDGEFASDWIESLRERCQLYLENNSGRAVTLEDIYSFVLLQPAGGPSVPTQDDVAAIMRTLELDEEIYSVQTSTGQMVYTLRNRSSSGQPFNIFASRIPNFITQSASQLDPPGLVVPCLSCPLVDQCRVGGRICPERCEYISHWLKSNFRKTRGAGSACMAANSSAMDDW